MRKDIWNPVALIPVTNSTTMPMIKGTQEPMYPQAHGPLKLIKVFILAYIAICLFGYQLDKVWEFWVLRPG
mgnify:CR=1 FL=1